MGWPQYTYMVLTLIGLGVIIGQHGEPKSGTHNAWAHIFSAIVVYFLLYSGGFFSKV